MVGGSRQHGPTSLCTSLVRTSTSTRGSVRQAASSWCRASVFQISCLYSQPIACARQISRRLSKHHFAQWAVREVLVLVISNADISGPIHPTVLKFGEHARVIFFFLFFSISSPSIFIMYVKVKFYFLSGRTKATWTASFPANECGERMGIFAPSRYMLKHIIRYWRNDQNMAKFSNTNWCFRQSF